MKRFVLILLVMMMAVTGTAAAQKEQTSETTAWVSFKVGEMKFRAPADWRDATTDPAAAGVNLALMHPDNSTNLNIVHVPNIGAVTPEAAQQELLASYPGEGIEVIESLILDLPQGQTLRMEMTPATVNPNAQQFQYVFLTGTDVYFLTLTSAIAVFEDFTPLFESIAHTVVLPNVEDAWPRTSGTKLSIQAPSTWEAQTLEADSVLDFALVDSKTNAIIGAYVEEVAEGYTAADAETAIKDWYAENGYVDMGIAPISLPLGDGVQGQTEVPYQDANGANLVDSEFEYRVVYGNQVIVFIGRCTPEQVEQLAPMFKMMVDTLLVN